MSIQEKQLKWVDQFLELSSWEDKYKLIIQLGKEHQGMDDSFKTDDNKVKGCQSQVWIVTRFEDKKIFFDVDSDALIAKGLIVIFSNVYSGETPQDILEASTDFIKDIGLEQNLTPSRTNGVFSMLKQIKIYALAYSQI